MKPKIKTTTSSYQLYQMLRLFSLILISILLVKSGFSKQETSTFELFLFIANISSYFWIMGISNSILSYFPRLSEKSKSNFFSNMFYLLQALGFIAAIVIYFTKGLWLSKSGELLNREEIFYLSLYVFFLSPTLLIEIKYILLEKYKSLKRYGIIIFSLQFLIIFILSVYYHDIFIVLKGLVLWIFIRWIWTLKIIFINNRKPSVILIKNFLIFGSPIIIHILLGNGMQYIDGIIVNRYFPPDKFSVYRYGAREFPLILILIGAIRSTMIPKAISDVNQAAQKIKEHINNLINIFFPVSVILMLTSKYLFTSFYSEEYSYSALLFNIYLLILSSRMVLAEVFIYAYQKNKIFVWLSLFELLFNIGLSLILLQFWGIAGIAFATFISYSLSKLYLVLYIKKKLNISPGNYLDIKKYLIFTIVLYLSFLLSLFV